MARLDDQLGHVRGRRCLPHAVDWSIDHHGNRPSFFDWRVDRGGGSVRAGPLDLHLPDLLRNPEDGGNLRWRRKPQWRRWRKNGDQTGEAGSMTVNYQPSSADELLSVHSKRIELIRQCANESSEKEFQRKWFSVLLRCAQWFSSVPLTPELHREPGGAFRATIETAFYALRLAGGQKFAADLTSEKRR